METQILTSLTPEELTSLVSRAVYTTLNEHLSTSRNLETPPDPPLDTDQACALLHWAKPTLYRHVQQSTIPYHRQGKKLLFFESELTAWIKSRTKK